VLRLLDLRKEDQMDTAFFTPTSPRPRTAPLLQREAFRFDRLAEFVGVRELVAQVGHEPESWLLVILKELVDNALDEAEEALIAPQIAAEVSTERGEIIITDPPELPEAKPEGQAKVALFDSELDFAVATRRLIQHKRLADDRDEAEDDE
jgi:hypothetical protein